MDTGFTGKVGCGDNTADRPARAITCIVYFSEGSRVWRNAPLPVRQSAETAIVGNEEKEKEKEKKTNCGATNQRGVIDPAPRSHTERDCVGWRPGRRDRSPAVQ
jgi:hypothetical protein